MARHQVLIAYRVIGSALSSFRCGGAVVVVVAAVVVVILVIIIVAVVVILGWNGKIPFDQLSLFLFVSSQFMACPTCHYFFHHRSPIGHHKRRINHYPLHLPHAGDYGTLKTILQGHHRPLLLVVMVMKSRIPVVLLVVKVIHVKGILVVVAVVVVGPPVDGKLRLI